MLRYLCMICNNKLVLFQIKDSQFRFTHPNVKNRFLKQPIPKCNGSVAYLLMLVLLLNFKSVSTMKTVFVTVGTTSFDDLIKTMTSDEVVQALVDRGYTDLVLQFGRGIFVPDPQSCPGLRIEAFRFKDSIAENIHLADLIISHAGAGSCLESLGAGKPLLVVVNDKLMDNHQLELAKQLKANGHLIYCTCSTLTQTLREMDLSALLPFLPGQPENFARFLDKAVGLV